MGGASTQDSCFIESLRVRDRAVKILAKVLIGILVLVLLGIGYVEMTYKKDYSSVPLPKITASTDPEVIAQGE